MQDELEPASEPLPEPHRGEDWVTQLTRKDNLAKNLKRYRKTLEKELAGPDELPMWFFPQTFQMPIEFSLFKEEFVKNPGVIWIMKPASRSQGKGIFLVNKLSSVNKWNPENYHGVRFLFQTARELHRPEVHSEPPVARREEVRPPTVRAMYLGQPAHNIPLQVWVCPPVPPAVLNRGLGQHK